MHIYLADEKDLLEQADELLYQVLWEPFGLPRDTRSKFAINGEQYVFVAADEGRVMGAFILIIRDEVGEIRHAAVAADHQGAGIGRALAQCTIDFATQNGVQKIEVYGRNTAIGFWESLGFVDTSGWLEHDFFVHYGIKFKKMAGDIRELKNRASS